MPAVGGMIFDVHIGIDYSGAATADTRLPGLRVYAATGGGKPKKALPPCVRAGVKNWTRREVYRYCETVIAGDQRAIIGIDHAFGFPLGHQMGTHSWDAFLDEFARRWPTTDKDVSVESLRASNPFRAGRAPLRLCECWTAGAKSVFQFDMQGSVAKSTRAGIPWIRCLRRDSAICERIHFWPFDGFEIPDGKSVVAEVYPSLWRRRFENNGRTADEQDSFATSRWLSEMDLAGELVDRYFRPPLYEQDARSAMLEGWILGVA